MKVVIRMWYGCWRKYWDKRRVFASGKPTYVEVQKTKDTSPQRDVNIGSVKGVSRYLLYLGLGWDRIPRLDIRLYGQLLQLKCLSYSVYDAIPPRLFSAEPYITRWHWPESFKNRSRSSNAFKTNGLWGFEKLPSINTYAFVDALALALVLALFCVDGSWLRVNLMSYCVRSCPNPAQTLMWRTKDPGEWRDDCLFLPLGKRNIGWEPSV